MTKIVELPILRMREKACLPAHVSQVDRSTYEIFADAALGAFLEDDFFGLISIDTAKILMTIKAKTNPALGPLDAPMRFSIFS